MSTNLGNPFFKISPNNADKLRNILIDILKEEQKELLEKGFYDKEIEFSAKVKSMVNYNHTKEEKEMLRDVSTFTFIQFVVAYLNFKKPKEVKADGKNSGIIVNAADILHKD